MDQRTVVVYPNAPAPQLPGFATVRRIAPPFNYNYRVNTAPRHQRNPRGRTSRPGITSGRITGTDQILNTPHVAWATPFEEVIDEYLADGPVVIRNNQDVGIRQHVLRLNRIEELYEVDVGVERAAQRLRDHYPNLYAQGNAVTVGQTFISRLALMVIGYLHTLPENIADLVALDKHDLLANPRIQDDPIRVMSMNTRLHPMYLIIEFLVEETLVDGEHQLTRRPVNKYETWFINPEDLRFAPSIAVDRDAVAQVAQFGRFINLNHRLCYLDLYQAMYRWWQIYQYVPYATSTTLLDITLTFREYNIPDPNMNDVPYVLRPPAAVNLSSKHAYNVSVELEGETANVHVQCPESGGHNCFFHAIKTEHNPETSEHQSVRVTDFKEALYWGAKDFAKRVNMVRMDLLGGKTGPIDIMSEEVQIISRFFNTPVQIYSTSLELLNECVWEGGRPPIKLMYTNSAETQLYLKKEDSYPDIAFGHVGIIDAIAQIQECPVCSKTWWKSHACRVEHDKGRRERCRTARDRHQKEDTSKGICTTSRPDFHATMKDGLTNENAVVYYDFETYRTDVTSEHVVYAVGALRGQRYVDFYGEYALDTFFEYLSVLIPPTFQYQKKRIRHTMILCAWNGDRYDGKLILRHALLSPRWKNSVSVHNLLINNGRILKVKYVFTQKDGKQVKYVTFDPVNFFMSSLRKACADFKISSENSKKNFPHKRIRKYADLMEKLSLDELNDPRYYFGEKSHRLSEPWTAEQVRPFTVIDEERGELVRLRELSRYYLKADVMGMAELCKKFFSQIYDSQKYDCWRYMTVSQMSYTVWHTNIDVKESKHLRVPPSDACYNAIKSSVYGGRVFVGRKEWLTYTLQNDNSLKKYLLEREERAKVLANTCPSDYEGLSTEDKNLLDRPTELDWEVPEHLHYHNLLPTDYLVELDFNSLYPSVMYTYDYPTGECMYTTELHSTTCEFEVTGRLPLGIYQVSYVPPTDLFLAVLPKRVKGALKWELVEGQGWYTSVDLENAYAACYTIKFHAAWIYPTHGKVFVDHVENAMKLKKEGDDTDNASLRAYGKLLANSLYGKMLQAVHRTTSEIVHTREDVVEFCKQSVWTGAMFIGNTVILKGINPEIMYNKPYQMGAFILAYSRRENLKKFNTLAPGYLRRKSQVFSDCNTEVPAEYIRNSVVNSPVYGDTDSMYVRGDQLTADLDLKNEFCHLKDEDATDFLKNSKRGKPGGKRILWMINLTVKTYAYVYVSSNNKAYYEICSKGINTEQLTFGDYIHAADHFGSFDYRGRLVDLGDSIRGPVGAGSNAGTFAKVFSVNLRRTFNKTAQTARVVLDNDFQLSLGGRLTVPVGHVLAHAFEEPMNEEEEMDQVTEYVELLYQEEMMKLQDDYQFNSACY